MSDDNQVPATTLLLVGGALVIVVLFLVISSGFDRGSPGMATRDELAATPARMPEPGMISSPSPPAEEDAERRRGPEADTATAADRVRALRADLNRNLNGAGGGFVRRWEWKGDTFVLVLDQSKYRRNSAIAAAMTARAMFETNGVVLPSTLVFRDTSGNVIDRGPFANVPGVP